jgi:hypothetical protein
MSEHYGNLIVNGLIGIGEVASGGYLFPSTIGSSGDALMVSVDIFGRKYLEFNPISSTVDSISGNLQIQLDSKANISDLSNYTLTSVTQSISGELSNYTLTSVTQSISGDLQNQIDQKQNILISGTDIKTINGNTLLGSGNLTINSGGLNWTPIANTGIDISPSGQDYIFSVNDYISNTQTLAISANLQNQINSLLSGSSLTLTGGTYISLSEITPNEVYIDYTGTQPDIFRTEVASISGNLQTQKQNTLISGSNIKTINGVSLLGSGDISISGGTGSSWTPTSGTGVTITAPTSSTYNFSVSDYISKTESVSISADLQTQLTNDSSVNQHRNKSFAFDEFLGTGNIMGWQASLVGGSWVNTSVISGSEFGLLRSSTGTVASTNQRGAAHTGSPSTGAPIYIGFGQHIFEAKVAPAVNVFNGSLTGTIWVGIANAITSPSNGLFFRSTDGGNWFAVTRSGGVETGTATDTGIPLSIGTFRRLKIVVNSTATSVSYFVDGVLIATHVTNIPSSSSVMSHIISVNRSSATGTEVALDIDWTYYEKLWNNSRF